MIDDKRVNNDQVYLVALAGLLYNAGKFAQWAGWQHGKPAEIGVKFVRQYVPEQWQESLYPVMEHRDESPEGHLGKSVALADRLSAGVQSAGQTVQPKQLLSIFCCLKSDGKEMPQKRYWPLKPLALEEDVIFPGVENSANYGDLWSGFEGGIAALRDAHVKDGNLATYLESLLLLMQRYTWCVPSAYYHSLPDVSFYDHSRTTAALAACFAGMDEAVLDDLLRDSKQETDVALLVGGDISGVQKFIYSIASENAAKSLRGRSFYLQLLTEAVVSYTLAQLKLPITNLLYAGGGNFYLLAPSEATKQLEKIQTQVTRRLFQAHEGNLRLALAWTPAAAHEFETGAFAVAWDRLHQRLRRAKERPLAELPADEMAKHIGQGKGEGGHAPTCSICAREQDHLLEGQACSLCESLEELGRGLAYATHLVVAHHPSPDEPRAHINRWWHGLEQFGINVWPVNVRKEPVHEVYLPGGPQKAERVYVYPLPQRRPQSSDTALFKEAAARGPVVTAFRPFARLVPHTWRNGREGIATFDELAEHSQGIERWGVLRMDVDGLGKLFRDGFKRQEDGRNDLTLSRLASLSFALSLFFEGYVATIGQPYQAYTAAPKPKHQAEKQGHYDKLYVQYAGGDDLFVVGAWDVLPKFAADVRNKFAKYVCDNPNVTLSGGITLHPPKFPLYQAADQAGRAEHAAKSFRRRVKGREVEKDAIAFLGQTLSWGDLAQAQQRQETILRWLSQGASRAIIQHLRTLYQEWLDGQEKAKQEGRLKANQFYYGPWIWHTVYQLTRTAQSSRNKKTETEIQNWEDELLKEGNTLIGLVGLAARWADYLTRTREGG